MKPHLEIEGLNALQQRLAVSNCYLEYGSGGSTVLACKQAGMETVISVDSDIAWLRRVKESVPPTSANIYLCHARIGEVGDWGVPQNSDCYRSFWKYTVLPWDIVRQNSFKPDTILIDGRFRVSCFLYSLLHAPFGAQLYFDDFFDRPEYQAVLQFARVARAAGRMAVFEVADGFCTKTLVTELSRYIVDWD